MPFYKHIKLFLLIFLWFNLAFSQNYPSKNYTSANKLPNNVVRSLLIDSNNVLWIGTENGVVKKENDDFKHFFEEDGLALNSCWAIAEDSNKSLWFGSYGGGVSIYDGVKFRVISEKDGLVHNEITKLFSKENKMYVGTSNGVSIIDTITLEILSLNNSSGDELFRVQGFFEYRENIYVVTYSSGVFKITVKHNKAALVKVNNHEFIYSVFVDKDSILSSNKGYFTRSSLADYVNKDDSLSAKKLGASIIWDYVKTKDQKIYTAAWGIYDSNGGIYEVEDSRFISKASDFKIPSKKVISLAYDATFEKLYVGSMDSGLFEIKLNPKVQFHSTPGENVIGFAQTNKSSAVLLHDGLRLTAAERKQEINLDQLKKWQENYILNTELPLPKYQDHFYELDYTTGAEDISFYDIKVSGDIYWINTNIGIFAINDFGKLYQYLPLHSEEINFTEAGDLIETHPYGGARIYKDLDTFEYTHYKQEDPQTPTMVVNSLKKDHKTYFLSVFSGLYVWENNKFRSYVHSGIWSEKKLRHVTTFGDDIAISNEFGDVFIVNDQESFKLLRKIPRAQIQGNTISFLKEYKGSLLIGTEKGLTLVNNDRKIFLDEEQGLEQPFLSAEINQNKLSIGSKEGFYTIDLDAVCDTQALIHDLTVREVFINNNNISFQKFTNREEIELPYDQNSVLLKFNTNAHPYPNKLKYQYRLSANEKWSLPFSKPEIFLPFLTPNDYDVTVKVSDQSTGLSFTQPLVSLAIFPPFWKTWWFALLVMSTLLLVVYSVYSFQIKQHRKYEEQKGLIQKRFEETKMEALLAQMNPHFIFNAMNSIQNYIMDSDIDNATLFLGDFAKLIRLNLDYCTKPTILLVEEIEYLQSYIRVENTRFNNAVKVKFDIDPQLDVYDVEIPTMVLQTFVENVFVHAFPAGMTDSALQVSFELLSENVLQCKIEDNGIGFTSTSANKLHISKGVNLVKERLTMLGYDIENALQITSTKDKGTTVSLKLQV